MNEKTTTPNSNFGSLNPAQMEAVDHTEGALLILAGAGTGKTKVLTSRIANILMQGTPPANILAVTFTNKASKEMTHRIDAMTNGASNGMWLGTFHSIAAKILRRHAEIVGLQSNFTIIDYSDQLRLVKRIFTDFAIDEKRWDPKLFISIMNRFKDQGLTPEKVSYSDVGDFAQGRLLDIYKEYQARLKQLNAADFGDLLLHNLTIFAGEASILADYQTRFEYILVDEYQDTNIAQYIWLRLLAQERKNICCVGDDDQSIYGWRGAEVGNILKFEKDFPNAKVVRLERNYRSTSHILAAASGLIANNENRMGKTLWTEGNEGDPIKIIGTWDDEEEARRVADEIESLQQLKQHKLSQIAILVRAGFQTRTFEETFIKHNIAYKVIGGLRFYERLEIRDVIAYLRVIAQNDDDLAFERIINTPKRGIGSTSLQIIRQTGRENNISMYKAINLMLDRDLFKPKMKRVFTDLLSNFARWQKMASQMPVAEFVDLLLKESGYLDMWKLDNSVEAQGRIENIKELVRALEDFENIGEFLEHVSLVSDIDNIDEENMVNIMTLHASKGLEFETVFLPGWEEGVFPHQRSLDEVGQKALEEERRLAYVGITRAKKRAFILYAGNRRIFGRYQSSIASRFIEELPEENIEKLKINNGFNLSSNDIEAVKQKYINTGSSSSSWSGKSQTKSTAKSDAGFSVGQRIFHIKFGYGKIKTVSGDQLEIAFEKAGSKKIIDRYVEAV